MGSHRNRRPTSSPNGLLYGSGCPRAPSCFTCPLKDCVEAKRAVYVQKEEIPEDALKFQREAQGLISDAFDKERITLQPFKPGRVIVLR
jgi:hypothetical protein